MLHVAASRDMVFAKNLTIEDGMKIIALTINFGAFCSCSIYNFGFGEAIAW